jgi:hypothetical protein
MLGVSEMTWSSMLWRFGLLIAALEFGYVAGAVDPRGLSGAA